MLNDRFFSAIKPFHRLLQMCGVQLSRHSGSKRKLLLLNLWSSFWLILNFQSQCHTLFRRTPFQDLFTGKSFVEWLNNVGFRLVSFICDIMSHNLLVYTIQKSINSVINFLEPTDFQLGRPNLSKIHRSSLLAVIWIAATVKIVNVYRIFFFRKCRL